MGHRNTAPMTALAEVLKDGPDWAAGVVLVTES